MSTVEFVGDILTEFGRSFEPITESLAGGQSFSAFLAEFGWQLDPKSDINVIQRALGKIPTDVAQIPDAISNLEKAYQKNDIVAAANATLEFEKIIKDVVDVVQGLSTTTASNAWPAPLNSSTFWNTFPADLLEYLLFRYLQVRAPKLFAPLYLLGVLSDDYTVPVTTGRVAYVRRGLRWDRLVDAVTKPEEILVNVYGWGGKFDAYRLLDNIRGLAIAYGLQAGVRNVPAGILAHYYDESALSHFGAYELTIPLYWAITETGPTLEMVSVELAVLPIPPSGNRSGSPVGLAIFPRVTGGADAKFNLTSSTTVELAGNFVSEALVRAEIRPTGAGIFVDPTLKTQIDASATVDGKPPDPWILLGRKPGTRLELSHVHAALRAKANVPDFEIIGELAADSGALVIEFGEGDGFISTVLKGSQKMEFGLGFAYSSKTGFRFNGQVGLEATIAIHQSLAGLLNLDSLYLAFHAKSDPAGASLIVAATGGVSIGPVVATVKKVGVSMDLTPVKKGDSAGNLGLANFGFGFKPPEGISVALSAPGVSGVGFLDIDTEHHQYLGAIAISVGDIDISAVGVLNTKLPDGSSGYSLIVVVSASFPPIELGFGFDLTGIGGLVGVNRTVDVPRLQALARSGGLDQLMFPEDLIHKAPQVAANLGAIFPSALQHFLIGPAVQIEWGSDGILDAEIGILIELSDAGGGIDILRIALLGFFHITLPQAEAPVADITLDVLGLLDIPAKTISIDAGMRDSKVAGFTLTGQAALRAGWGAHANFVLALGGFNPAFNAPAGFPLLARIALSLGDDNPRLRFASYFALTPNTLQFGAAADLYASEGPAAVTASLAFDVLIQFKPFGLLVDLTISAAILFNGSPLLTLNLALHLSGPDPWHVTGRASLTVLFATFSVPINVTIGDAPAPQLPTTVNLDKNLTDALADLHNWQIGPQAGGGGVVVRSFDQANKGVHPTASLTVRQHAVPLHQAIDRYGPDLVTPCSYDITKVQLGSQVVADKNITPVTDQFAPAQFITMSDADKLSAPSFESMKAGVTIGAAGLVLPLTGPADDPQTKVVDTPSTRTYDLLTMDVPDAAPAPPPEPPSPRTGGGGKTRRQLLTPRVTPPARRQVMVPGDLLKVQHAAAAAAVNGADGRGAATFRGPVTGFAVVHPTWAILGLNLATKADGRELRTDLSSKTAARSWVERELPAARVQVVYKSELPGAAAPAGRSIRV